MFIFLLKFALFFYEVIRVIILGIILVLQPFDTPGIIRIIFAAQGVLFPLMALFICIDTSRYKEYLPLFITGKGITVLSLVIFTFFFREAANFTGQTVLVSFDLLALAGILFIKRDIDISTKIETEPEKEKS